MTVAKAVRRLSDLDNGATIKTDLVVIGGGPAGLTIAQETARQGLQVLILESGLEAESVDHASLNAVDSIGELGSQLQVLKRQEYHTINTPFWSGEDQKFGVRCRGLGGSTQAWAGKSAIFDPIDFQVRPWVPHSGWPIDLTILDPYLKRAIEVLNLSPDSPSLRFQSSGLRSFYWQFARSKIFKLDVMRFGREYAAQLQDGIQVLLDATATKIGLEEGGSRFAYLEAASLSGTKIRVEAAACVLAASSIENPRLLLASNDVAPAGIGNDHDNVGRYLMDHAGARIGSVKGRNIAPLMREFGFKGVFHEGRAHMFMHGLAINPETQEREGLLNAALYFLPRRSPTDPWDALKRLLKRSSKAPVKDIFVVGAGAGFIIKGIGMKMLTSRRFPKLLKDTIVNAVIRFKPGLAVSEFQSQGLPHKLVGLTVEAIAEQQPDPESRILLSERRDQFGVPLAKIDWKINQAERNTLRALANLLSSSLAARQLPQPEFEPWSQSKEDAVIIDLGHTLGTTRMSDHPRDGVVNADCQVHGVDRLFIAGGSVFPTSGHANPTLMILALAIRLADHIVTILEMPAASV